MNQEDEIKNLKTQIIKLEKLATVGQLTAGILHEIRNPLNFVSNFANLSLDLTTEIKEVIEEADSDLNSDIKDELEELTEMIRKNIRKISEHGKRAERIIVGMLANTRESQEIFKETNINQLTEDYVKLAYHGLRGQDSDFNAEINFSPDKTIKPINVVQQDLGRVILNIANNAFYVLNKISKQKTDFKPVLEVKTENTDENIIISIKDNGTGIPEKIKKNIFKPFYSTKPPGEGTGLGLSMSYDIITETHKGKLEINTEFDRFTQFTITIPKNLKN